MSLLKNFSKDEVLELPMIDMMYHYLQEQRQPVSFYSLMNEIAVYKNWTEEEKQQKLVQAYTDMNIDGRFVSLGDNQWGLKSWYPVEQTEEELATTIKPKKRKRDDLEESDEELEENDDSLEPDDEMDLYDEDDEIDLLDDEEDEETIEEDVVEDEYDLDDEE